MKDRDFIKIILNSYSNGIIGIEAAIINIRWLCRSRHIFNMTSFVMGFIVGFIVGLAAGMVILSIALK